MASLSGLARLAPAILKRLAGVCHASTPSHFARFTLGLLLVLSVRGVAAQTFVAYSNLDSLSGTSINVPKPSGIAANDILIAQLRNSQGANWTTAATGWTKITQNNNSSNFGQAVFWKLATGAEPATYTFTAAASASLGGSILAFRGIDTTAPIQAFSGTAPSGSPVTVPSITTTSVNALVVVMVGADSGSPVYTLPAGLTSIYNRGGNSAYLTSGAAGYYVDSSPGSTGNFVATMTSPKEAAGHAVALKPAGASSSVDHYELSLPTGSLACLATTVTVSACTNSTSPCTSKATTLAGQTATLATSGATLGATSVSFDATGVATTTLSYPSASNGTSASVTLSGEQTAAANARQCCPNGSSCSAANSCSTTFNTAGFIVAASANGSATTIPARTAGTASGTYTLRAVQTSTTTKACEAALVGSTSVNWAHQCNNPTTCSAGNRMSLTGNSATTIAANPNSGVTSTTAVAMTFDANGNAPFTFNYSDVGQVTLFISKAAGGSLLTSLAGSTNAFVVKPAGFTLSNIKCTSYAAGSCATSAIASPGNNPGAASAGGTAFIPAGKPFSATVTAVDSSGGATPNYGRETAAEGVTLSSTLVLPSGGSAAALANAGAFGGFSAGVATGTTFAWPEVGIITLTPSVADGDYLGAGNVSGAASGNVGRFIPHHFDVAVTPACSSFSYAAQPFGVVVSAKNGLASPTTTVNYDGSAATSPNFAKAVSLSDAPALGVGSFGGTGTLAATLFSAGVATANTPAYSFTAKLTAPQSLVVRAIDADAVSSSGFAEGQTPLRSGRLRLSNAFGSEKSALAIAVQAQYWSGNAWVQNSADSCTSLPSAAVVRAGYLDNKGATTSAWTSTVSAITITGGSGAATVSAPSPTATGSVDVALNLGGSGVDQSCLSAHPASTAGALPWLRSQNGACSALWDRDPSARASFGIYTPETRKTIHVRELF